MANISTLIEGFAPVASEAQGGALLDRFLDLPGCDLLAVVSADGHLQGVVARGGVRPQDATRTALELMQPAICADPDTEIGEACGLLLSQRDPPPGLVVTEAGAYRGVVAARALLKIQSDMRHSADASRRFMEVVSHEVRSPMNGVLAVAELLLRQPLSADAQAHVRTIIESSHATLRALSDALELAPANTADLALRPGPAVLRDMMDEVQAGWSARAAVDGVTLLVGYDGPPDLSAVIDAARVKQVFDGLIETALTFNRRGAIEVSLQASRTAEGLKLVGRVRDVGGALSIARLSSLLANAAAPGDPRAPAPLCLMLCRRIVERMAGTIGAEANVGAGATILFEFRAPEAVAEAPAPLRPSAEASHAHVLVVDDNATNRMVAEALCEMFDLTSECVVDGVEAVEAARTGRFDLILMDIRMPRMDGVEAARAIRKLPGTAGAVPIIALTANADPEDAKVYLASGMMSVVEKPLKPERLLEAIDAALTTRDGRRASAA